ncbi:hypothetical protein [Legionella hackeliae]|uniref:Uncharacterized protein n=1 Tax=Legionella hackeliae TaxID=449 RepID=A0A0A8URY0_LEGHA|nr:hypothetical protein [Legionella hackeliae]KTD10358.1 hypothetical protein Lhac_2726 [Legionella hackeliae]CEK09857.1 protein of unknown function [Legionella hackeliae]STX49767.1 Uncharacterised protein [Legionella hackeliae]
MYFFKISKKNPQKTTLFTRVSDGPKGNSVVCIAKKENGTKRALIKVGDVLGNESFYESVYADEIEVNEELFAISREMFCGDLIRTINPGCTSKYNRYHGKDLNELFIGSDFMEHFKTWKASYNHSAQTILGYKINSEGDVVLPQGATKPVRGLGACAVLLTVLGRGDRGYTNWGVVECDTHLQITLIDFGQCLIQFILFEDEDCKDELEGIAKNAEDTGYLEDPKDKCIEEQNTDNRGPDVDYQDLESSVPSNSKTKEDSDWLNFKNPFDVINAVFQQYSSLAKPILDNPQAQYVEPPLPGQFLQSQHIKCEIFETIHQLHSMPFSDIVKIANDNFKEFPGYKAAMLQDKKLIIEHLYNQFKDDKEYVAVQFINRCFVKLNTGFKLSNLDDNSINYILSIYRFVNPQNDSYKEAIFCKQIRTMLRPEERMEMQSDIEETPVARMAPQSS